MSESSLLTLVRGAGANLLGKVGSVGLIVLAHVLIARLYGPAGFGLFAIAWTLLRLGSFLGPLGMDSAVVRFGSMQGLADGGGVRGIALRGVFLAVSTGAALGLVLFLAAPWLTQLFGEPELLPLLRIVAIALPLAGGLRVASAATRISERMTFSVLSEHVTQPVTFVTLVVVFHLLGLGIVGSVIAVACSYVLGFAIASGFIVRLYEKSAGPVEIPSRRLMLAFSVPTALAGSFSLITLWSDRLFIGYFATAESVGIYQAASQSAMMFIVVNTAVNGIIAPLISRTYARGDLHHLGELFGLSTRWALCLTLPAFLVVLLQPGLVLGVLFGGDYVGGSVALVLLTLGQLINVATGVVAFLFVMTGRQRGWLGFSAAAATVNVGLNLVLIPRLGIVGAAVATSTSLAVLFVPALLHIRGALGVWPFDRKLVPAAVATGVSLAVLLLVRDGGLWTGIVGLALYAALALGTFWGTLLLLGIPREDRDLMRAALSREAGEPGGTATVPGVASRGDP
jgi:O-antigen/teichoic acid export membrane protein